MKHFYKNTFSRFMGFLPFIIFIIFIFKIEIFSNLFLYNGILQFVLFIFITCIPAYLTKRMSYVDIAWPLGLVLIGILVLTLGEGYPPRIILIASIYLFSGLRMGVGALVLLKKGYLNSELSRYKYQRKRWDKAGYKNLNLSLQYEIMIQCFANITFLALPAFLMAQNTTTHISISEIIGVLLWATWFVIEHISDMQKQQFLKKSFLEKKKKQVCNIGFWKYTRHPNYFAEWMVWNAIILSSMSSYLYFYNHKNLLMWILIFISLLYVSFIMYSTLVYYTGAVPSEYYSLKRRPYYKIYQEQTNRFFPGPKKVSSKNDNK